MKTAKNMTQMATKKSVKQLQAVYDYLDHRNGIITTDKPGTWWNLVLEKVDLKDNTSEISIGVYHEIGGDVIYDPIFYLNAQMDGDRIICANLCQYVSDIAFMAIVIDENDRLVSSHGEKDIYGLRRRFSAFMDNVTEVGPYLVNGKVKE